MQVENIMVLERLRGSEEVLVQLVGELLGQATE